MLRAGLLRRLRSEYLLRLGFIRATQAAAQTIRVIAADPKHLGAETGMIAILHTWGQTLTHHPHVHCIVPGGGLGPDGRWVACKPNFFLPVHVLSRCYRRLFLERLRTAFARRFC